MLVVPRDGQTAESEARLNRRVSTARGITRPPATPVTKGWAHHPALTKFLEPLLE